MAARKKSKLSGAKRARKKAREGLFEPSWKRKQRNELFKKGPFSCKTAKRYALMNSGAMIEFAGGEDTFKLPKAVKLAKQLLANERSSVRVEIVDRCSNKRIAVCTPGGGCKRPR